MTLNNNFDLIVMGGGIAGMTAAIYAAKANVKTAIIETDICGGLVNSTYVVENFPSYVSIHGMELMQKVRSHVDQLEIHVEEVAELIRVELVGPIKEIETDEGVFSSRAVILATGRTPTPLDIDTDCRQVHYCSICDGSAYKGKKVLVVGGGNSGFDEALYLLSVGVREIVLVEQMDRVFASQSTQDKFLAYDGTQVRVSTRVKALTVDDRLRAVVLENVDTGRTDSVEIDGIFVYMGQRPNTGFAAETVDLDEHGYIRVNQDLETNLMGIFAAGDVTPKHYRQITTAMADGTVAALNAARYLNNGN